MLTDNATTPLAHTYLVKAYRDRYPDKVTVYQTVKSDYSDLWCAALSFTRLTGKVTH